MERIGKIEILKTRIYPLDSVNAYGNKSTYYSTVVVNPGKYPLYKRQLSFFWMMTGFLNVGKMHRMGDGLFSVQESDEASEIEVVFPSPFFGPDEWKELLRSVEFRENHPDQRLRWIQ